MFGLGMLKGLSVTMRHFVESYLYDRKLWEKRYNDEWLAKHQAIDGKGLFTIQYPVLRAASITPPAAPKIFPAPVLSPKGLSYSPSGSFKRSKPRDRKSRINSRVVRTASVFGYPSFTSSGRSASYFLAVHGMIATWKILLGSIF